MRVSYVGPHDEVDVAATGHRCKRGESVDVPENVGRGLIQQKVWSEVKAQPKPAQKNTPKKGD